MKKRPLPSVDGLSPERATAIRLAQTTSAVHLRICAFYVFDRSEPCDCGGVERAIDKRSSE